MSSLDAHKKQLTAAVQSLMTTSIPASLPRIEGLLTTHFPYASPSAATKAYTDALAQSIQASANNGGNGPIADAIDAVADEVSAAVDAIISIERFIQLSTPKMEDGNNFGVSVQMTVSKELKDIREALGKVTAGFPDYFDKRAGAFEKISNLPSETQSTSESSSSSTGGKEGDEKKSSSSTSTEKKQSTREDMDRIKSVVAIDVKTYTELRTAMMTIYNSMACVLDVMEKNYEKLEKPKGSGGGRNYDNMY